MSKNALLVLKKEAGVTSFTFLSSVKRYFKGEKVGHAGTLDKFATGLMLVLVGKATKLNFLFSSFDKTYVATIKFGIETVTLDPEGEIIKEGRIPGESEIKEVLPSFIGKQKQIPPLYSALHVNGKRAYQIARQGKSVEMEERDIEIYSINFISFDNGIATIELKVSKGTYIRSFARDLGIRLGTCAHLIELERTEIGPFSYNDITRFEEAHEQTLAKLMKIDGIYKLDVKKEAVKSIANGYLPPDFYLGETEKDGYYLAFYKDSCIAIINKTGQEFQIVTQYEAPDE